jgi:hypothetical protein
MIRAEADVIVVAAAIAEIVALLLAGRGLIGQPREIACGLNSAGQSALQVFGPTASGNVAPTRTITHATNAFESVTILPNGHAAVTAQPYTPSASASNTILEFSPTAPGVATPNASISIGPSIVGGNVTSVHGFRADANGTSLVAWL